MKPKALMAKLLLAAAMAAAMAAHAVDVSYIDPIDPDNPEKSADCAAITDSTTMLSAGWYVVDATVNNANRIAVSGDVNIVLRGVLHADKGFHVTGGDSLTVWKAVEGGGEVYVEDADDNCAGIGGDDGQSCGVVTVNGGDLWIWGGKCGAGVGGGNGGDGGKVTVNGGWLRAYGKEGSAGIGGGDCGNGGELKVTGGVVSAFGSTRNDAGSGQASSAIGAGRPKVTKVGSDVTIDHRNSGTNTIIGGVVIAAAGEIGGSGDRRVGAQTIGVSLDDADFDTGVLTLGDIMVRSPTNATELCAAAERMAICRQSDSVRLESCILHDRHENGNTCRWCGAFYPPDITDIEAGVQGEWVGKITVTFNVSGDPAGTAEWSNAFLTVTATDNETGSNYVAVASALSGDTGTEAGEHSVVWDMYGQGIRFKSDDVTFTVAYAYDTGGGLGTVCEGMSGGVAVDLNVQFAPEPEPEPQPAPQPEPVVLHALHVDVTGAAPSAASVYNGYLFDVNGTFKGTIRVNVGKPAKRSGKAIVKATVQIVGVKRRVSLKTTEKKPVIAADGPTTVTLVGRNAEPCVVTFGEKGLGGNYGEYVIDGMRNCFSSKDRAEKDAAKALQAELPAAVAVAWSGGTLSVTSQRDGSMKAAGMLASGTRVSAKSQLFIGDDWCGVAVVWSSKKGEALAFVLWLPRAGGALAADGLAADAVIGLPGTLKADARFRLDADAFASVWGMSPMPYLPDGLAVAEAEGKLVVADGASKGKVALKKGEVDTNKLGVNPSGLSLKYKSKKSKDGLFSGSFYAYTLLNGELKKVSVSVSGVLVNGIGYGSAYIKKVGSVPVTIE